MFPFYSRIPALLILAILIFSAGRISTPCGARGDAAPAPAAQKAPKELLEKRLHEVKIVWDMKLKRLEFRKGQPSDLFGWSERWLEAELALADEKEDRIKALKAHVDRLRAMERIASFNADKGLSDVIDAHMARYERANAEIHYSEAAGKVPPASER